MLGLLGALEDRWRQWVLRLPGLSSWKLFINAPTFWVAFDNPIFVRDIKRQPVPNGLVLRLRAFQGLTAGLAGGVLLGGAVMSL